MPDTDDNTAVAEADTPSPVSGDADREPVTGTDGAAQ